MVTEFLLIKIHLSDPKNVTANREVSGNEAIETHLIVLKMCK